MAGKPAYEIPSYVTDELHSDDHLRVTVTIQGLKTSKTIRMVKYLPKMVKEVANGQANVEFQERSFQLTFFGSGNLDKRKFELSIRRLPHPIIPDKSSWEIHTDTIVLLLRKVERGSWYPELEDGLETADETT